MKPPLGGSRVCGAVGSQRGVEGRAALSPRQRPGRYSGRMQLGGRNGCDDHSMFYR